MTAAAAVDDADHFIVAANRFLATAKLNVSIASHAGGQPQEGRRALLAAANATLNIHFIFRHADGASRVNIGGLPAGSGRNIIAGLAEMKIETHGADSAINQFVKEQAITIIQGAA